MDKTQLNKTYFEAGDWLRTTYKGRKLFKYTTDIYRYEQILLETEPDLIIETGTLEGGSAMWFRDHSDARIITLDINNPGILPKDIIFIHNNSLNFNEEYLSGFTDIMVVLDSDHSKDHVLAELKKFAPLVTKGCYLVVEDTFISRYLNNEDPNNDYSNGSSWEAIQEWDSTGFEQEEGDFSISMNPGGWFKRV